MHTPETHSSPAVFRHARIALIAALLAASLASCAGGKKGAGGFQMPPVPVEVSDVRAQTVRDQFRAVGTLEAENDVTIVSENAGMVRSLTFREGQPVRKGALLAQLDDRELRADAQRTEAQHHLDAANYERARKLAEQQAISQRELDDAHAALQVSEASASLARVRLDKSTIRAPFDGMIGRRLTSVGAWLKAGDPIAQVAKLNPLRVAFAAPERMLGELRPGRTVTLRTPAWPDRAFDARLTVVDPNVDPRTRTVQLLASVPNPGQLLRPGLSADVSVTLAERPKSITIPDEAVFAEGNGSYVFIVKPDSSVAKVAVSLGSRDSARVEVLHGLESGQTVVRTGHQKLFDGMMGGGGPGGPGGAAPGKPAAGAAKGGPQKSGGAAKPAGRDSVHSKTTRAKATASR